MIVNQPHHWFRLLFVWRGSVLHKVAPRLALVAAVSALSLWLRPWWLGHFGDSALSIPPFTLMGIALAIFLGFRNTVSYERYWEARRLWGSLLNASRSFARGLLSFIATAPEAAPEPALAARVRRRAIAPAAIAHALTRQLREQDATDDLRRVLGAEIADPLAERRFKPAMVLLWIGTEVGALRRAGHLDAMQQHALEQSLGVLSEVIGGCERIAHTPIPYTYRVLLNRTITLYCLLLPIGLTTSIGWLTPVIACFIAYTFFALDAIGEEIEEPFGTAPNDLALTQMSENIEATLREMCGERLPPRAASPVADIVD